MKVNLIILLFFVTIVGSGQNLLPGKYCNEPNMFVKCFTFNEDSSFEYYFIGDLGPYEIRGEGTYTMKENILSLNFENDDTLKSSYSIKDLMESQGDSIVLSFLVVDKEFPPLPHESFRIVYWTNNLDYFH